MCLFKYIEQNKYDDGFIDKMSSLSKWKIYIEMLYIGVGITGSCPYGDVVPTSWPEQVLGVLA